MVAYLLLGLAQVVGLLAIPFSPFGVWLQLAALGAFAWWTDFQEVGTIPLLVLATVLLAAELCEGALGIHAMDPAHRRVGGIGALIGAIAGAAAGLAFPLLGQLFGAVLGGFAGGLLAVIAGRRRRRIRFFTLIGQGLAVGLRAATGAVVATFVLFSVLSF